jgi:hypothetical protein
MRSEVRDLSRSSEATVDSPFAVTDADGDVWRLSVRVAPAGDIQLHFVVDAMIDGARYRIFSGCTLDRNCARSPHDPRLHVRVWPTFGPPPGTDIERGCRTASR